MAKLDDVTLLKRQVRKQRKHLIHLTTEVRSFLRQLDAEIPSSERGSRIAKLSNMLNMANDHARYFGLGIDYRKDKERPRGGRGD